MASQDRLVPGTETSYRGLGSILLSIPHEGERQLDTVDDNSQIIFGMSVVAAQCLLFDGEGREKEGKTLDVAEGCSGFMVGGSGVILVTKRSRTFTPMVETNVGRWLDWTTGAMSTSHCWSEELHAGRGSTALVTGNTRYVLTCIHTHRRRCPYLPPHGRLKPLLNSSPTSVTNFSSGNPVFPFTVAPASSAHSRSASSPSTGAP